MLDPKLAFMIALVLSHGCGRVSLEWPEPCTGAGCDDPLCPTGDCDPCVDGSCDPVPCTSNTSCDEACVAGDCVPFSPAGGACDEEADCESGLTCNNQLCEVIVCASDSHTLYDSVGTGTPSDPFILCSVAQLLDLMRPASAGGWSSSFRLESDIDLTGYDQATAEAVRPIGDATVPFSGVFDGGGHTISALHYEGPSVDYVGLFGRVEGPRALVRDLRVTNAVIAGSNYVGGLVGWLAGGATVMGCSTSGSVAAANEYAGGLVGVGGQRWSESGSTLAVITTSSSSATVHAGGSFAGGLAGSLGEFSYCMNSYATGPVLGGRDFVGGLIGGGGHVVVHSYALGAVSGVNSVGGLTGSLGGTVIGSFAMGAVSGSEAVHTGALVGDHWGTVEDSYSYSGAACVATGGCHGVVAGETAVADPSLFADPLGAPLATWDLEHVWVAGSAPPTLAPATFDLAAFGDCSSHLTSAPFAGGYGTLEAPFLVCTAAQLAAVNDLVEGGQRWRAVELAGDVDLTGFVTTAFPIGDELTPFTGFFDGAGHTITGFSYLSSAESCVGLFASVTGVIRRVGLENASISGGTSSQGLLAGEIGSGVILDSYARGSVTALGDSAGGLVGKIHYSAIQRTYFEGSVTANRGAGLVGFFYEGAASVQDSFASASVSVTTEGSPLAHVSSLDAGNYFDVTKPCSGCTSSAGTASPTTEALYDPANPPLGTWDFEHIWQSNAPADFPSLR